VKAVFIRSSARRFHYLDLIILICENASSQGCIKTKNDIRLRTTDGNGAANYTTIRTKKRPQSNVWLPLI
jgi:hypothetical protein